MLYGYCRVSTQKQNLERQIEMVKREYPEAIIYKDKYTGTTTERPEWLKLYNKLKTGDVVVFENVDRMSRNAEEGAALYEELYNRGVELIFIKNPGVNTSIYREKAKQAIPEEMKSLFVGKGEVIGKIPELFDWVNSILVAVAKDQIIIAFQKAEEEAQKIRERTKEGLRIAADQGRKGGRTKGQKYTTKKEKEARAKILKHSRTFGGTMTDIELIDYCGVNRNTYYSYKRKLLAEQSKADQVTE